MKESLKLISIQYSFQPSIKFSFLFCSILLYCSDANSIINSNNNSAFDFKDDISKNITIHVIARIYSMTIIMIFMICNDRIGSTDNVVFGCADIIDNGDYGFVWL